MGWCYTFGIRCGSGCNHPMLVREGSRSCVCNSCGATCTGQFSNCHEIVFRRGGLEFQLRCLPDTALTEIGSSRYGELRKRTLESDGSRVGKSRRLRHAVNDTGSYVVHRGNHSLSKTHSSSSSALSFSPYSGAESASVISLSELHAGFAKLIESTAAINLSMARLEAEVASLRRDLTALSAALLNHKEQRVHRQFNG